LAKIRHKFAQTVDLASIGHYFTEKYRLNNAQQYGFILTGNNKHYASLTIECFKE